MKSFLIEVFLPEQLICRLSQAGEHLQYWKLVELNRFYSGRSWKRYDTKFGVLARQYLNTNSVRLIVRALDEEIARQIALSYTLLLKPQPLRKNNNFKV